VIVMTVVFLASSCAGGNIAAKSPAMIAAEMRSIAAILRLFIGFLLLREILARGAGNFSIHFEIVLASVSVYSLDFWPDTLYILRGD
jgi:hypothetical protein